MIHFSQLILSLTPNFNEAIFPKHFKMAEVPRKGGFKSEDTEDFFHCQNKYSKSLSIRFELVVYCFRREI